MSRQRDKQAVLTILNDGKGRSYDQIAQQGGEGLWHALRELVATGKVVDDAAIYYKVAVPKGKATSDQQLET